MKEPTVAFALGLLCAFFINVAFSMGGIQERRNIQDYGGFTQEWSSIKWKCEAVK